MRFALFVALLISSALPVRAAEPPILNVLIQASAPVVRPGEQLTYWIDVFSTASEVEWAHLEIVADPRAKVIGVGVAVDGSLGEARCEPTLLRVSCEVPIKRWSPVQITLVVDIPPAGTFLWLCPPQTSVTATATLPDRLGERTRSVPIDAGTYCTTLPLIAR